MMMNRSDKMKLMLKTLSLAVACALAPTASMATQTTEQKIAQLEQQVKALQKQQTANLADKFKFNGFISGAYISADNDAGYNGSDTGANFSQDSKLGFQGTFNISDNTQAVMQLMMRGEYDWEVEAEWAYLSHRFNNGVQVRGGKLRVPLFMYSDYLDVGYAQPFARPPEEVYGTIPFSSYTGAGISYDVEYDESTLTMQAFGGESDVKNSNVKLSNLMGANMSWTDEVWTLRGVYATAVLDGDITRTSQVPIAVPPSSPPTFMTVESILLSLDDARGEFVGIGASYDNGEMLAVLEWTRAETDGAYPDTDAGYITLGYRIKAFTPYVTVAYIESTDDDERLPLSAQAALQSIVFNAERTAYSLGLRWDALDNLAVKFDLTYANEFGNTAGNLSANSATFNPLTGAFMYDDTLIYTVKFDAVF
jgi:phosphate-selective porin